MLRRSRRALSAAALLALTAVTAAAGEVELLGSHRWPVADHGLGGFSGIEVSDDGQRFTAISDRAAIVTGRFLREDGQITGIEATPVAPLLDQRGNRQDTDSGDSEGLAIGADGTQFISFENRNRVWAYRDGAAPEALPVPPFFRQLQNNSGIEALAIDAAGDLFAIPERSGRLDLPFPVWRFDGSRWSEAYRIPRRGTFLPVGADFGPDGRLYLLERGFSGFGFRTRVRRFDIASGTLSGEQVLIETPLLRHDNLEGISVWRDAEGALRLTMISDDNFNALQATWIVEYRMTPE